MTDEARLDLVANATSVDAATKSLDAFSASANRAQSATEQMAEAIKASEKAQRDDYSATRAAMDAKQSFAHSTVASATAHKTATAAAMDYVAALKELNAVTEKGGTLSLAARNALGGPNGVAAAYKTLSTGGLAAAIAARGANTELAATAKVAEEADRQVSKSVAGLSLFTREIITMGREIGRGDMTRLAGSSTLMAQALGRMASVSPLAVLGVIGLTAAVGGAIYTVIKGEEEFSRFNGILAATGNYSGFTASSFRDMAKSIAQSQDVTVGSVKRIGTELTATGKYSKEAVALMVENIEGYAKLTGENTDKLTRNYETMRGGIVKWAVTHEEQYHDLSLAQIDHINLLEKEGKHEEAIIALQTDIHKAIGDRITDYGYLQTALHDTATWASKLWDNMLGIGRPKTLAEQLEKAKTDLKNNDRPDSDLEAGGRTALQNMRQKVTNLTVEIQMQDQARAAQAKAAQIEDDRIRKKYDNQFKREKKEPKDLFKEEMDRLTAEAQGSRDLAIAYDVSTEAGFKAAAMKKALVQAARLHADGVKAEQLKVAELNVAVTAAAVNGAKYILNQEERLTADREVLKLMQDTGVSQQQANKTMADGTELQLLQAAAANANADDMRTLDEQIINVMANQAALNDINAEVLAQQQLNDQKAVNSDLDVQLKLINSTNRERAVQLAIMKAEQQLTKDGTKDLTSPTARKVIGAAISGANKQTDLADGIGDVIKQQQFYLKLLDQMNAHTKTAAGDMASSFGSIGKSLGDLITVFSDFNDQQTASTLKFNEDLKAADGDQAKIDALQIARKQDLRDASLKYYGDVAGAAASFFGKQTFAYQVLHATEQAYRAFEFASSVASVAVKAAEAAGKIPLNSAITASNIAAGASAMFAQLGVLAFPAVAAMIAVMVGLGTGALGSVKATGVNDSKANQANQGAGSVLGDPTAKSGSINNALSIANSNQNELLDLTNQMASSLRDIQNNIGTVANALTRSLNGSGALSPSSLGVGTTSSGPGLLQKILNPISALLPGLFGSKTTTSLTGQGLEFQPQTIGDILNNGISGNTYAQTVSETKKKFFGITYSDKSNTNNYSGALDDQLASQLTTLISSLRGGVLAAANTLGIEGASAVLDAFQVNIGKLDLTNMTGQQVEDALNAVFSKVADDMSSAILPKILEFAKVGEGAFETLVRVAHDYQVVDTTLASIGLTFKAIGVDSVAAREKLIDLAGGIDNFTKQADFFNQNFLTSAQQLAPIQNAVSLAMHKLGLDSIRTKEQFANLVLGLDVSTDAGAAMYDQLMAIAPAFAKIADAAQAANDQLAQNVTDTQSSLKDAYANASTPLQALISKYQSLSDTQSQYLDQLNSGPQAGLSPQDAYFAAKSAFEQDSQLPPDQRSTSIDDAFLTASRNYYASSKGYFDDLAKVKSSVQASVNYDKAQLAAAQASQKDLDDVVNSFAKTNSLLFAANDGIWTVNSSVLSVADAITAALGAIAAQQAAQQASVAVTSGSITFSNSGVTTTVPVASSNPAPTVAPDQTALLGTAVDLLAQANDQAAAAQIAAQQQSQQMTDAIDALRRQTRYAQQ